MKKDKKRTGRNYLEYIPIRSDSLSWRSGPDGIVTLDIANGGLFNRLAQKLFDKPKTTHVHLDELGSFVWPLLDGKKDIIELGKEVEAKFGEKAAPLYERLAKYFQILESYHFIELKDPDRA